MQQSHLNANSFAIEDASYLRLKNVVVSYKVPLKSQIIKSLQISATANNLITITKYSGFDHEVSQYQNSNSGIGYDFGSYPRSRTFLISLNVNF